MQVADTSLDIRLLIPKELSIIFMHYIHSLLYRLLLNYL